MMIISRCKLTVEARLISSWRSMSMLIYADLSVGMRASRLCITVTYGPITKTMSARGQLRGIHFSPSLVLGEPAFSSH